MCRLNLTVIIFIFICLLTYTEVKAQALLVSCDRSTIESYRGSEKEPVLRYLDEARQTADEFMRLFAEDRFDEIHRLNKSVIIFVRKESADKMVKMKLPAFRQEYGQLARYEYRNQHLSYPLGGPIELNDRVGTWYEIMTENSENDRHFISVSTHKYRVGDKPGISSLSLQRWGKNQTPLPWEYYEDTPKKLKGCVDMEDRLKVKIN